MNRLWLRFSLIFGLIVMLGPLLLLAIGLLTLQSGVLGIFIRNELNSPGSLTDQLIAYYHEQGSWAGVESLIEQYNLTLPRGPEGGGFELVFTDEGRQVIFGSPESIEQAEAENDGVRQVMAITVDGRTRGYLSLVQVSNSLGVTPSPNVLSQLSRILLSLGVGSAITGLIAGVIASRTLTSPLAQLAETARRFGKRDFTARAQVKGSIEMREVAQAFNEMAYDLDHAETLRRNLVADVAHELRTPLAVLQANLQALLDDVYPLEKPEIEKLMAQTELLTRLVTELRELSQAEAHQLPLQQRTVDLNQLLLSVVDTFQSTIRQLGITLEVEEASEPISIQADFGRLQQVLNNLVQNAIRHTPSGGKVKLSLSAESQQVSIRIQDTGEGIAPEHLPHVFDRFYRADRSRSRETGGTGLGLAIAKAIVELHKGTISVASPGTAGQGTTFTIQLPRGEAA